MRLLFGPGRLVFTVSTVNRVNNGGAAIERLEDKRALSLHSFSVTGTVILSGPSEETLSDSVHDPEKEVMGLTRIKAGRVHPAWAKPPWHQHAGSLFTLTPFIMYDLSNALNYDDLHLIINDHQTPPFQLSWFQTSAKNISINSADT